MSAIVTDQFRILNASNFVDSVGSDSNSYYIFVGLPNPALSAFGRSLTWDENTPTPVDNFSYNKHAGDVMMYGKKITSANIRRIIRRIDWVSGTRYEMYRDDYSILNPSPLTNASRLYDANYYVMNADYRVYICIDNGSSGDNPNGNVSQDQPTFTDLEPSRAGDSGDGYLWKYLFTVSPSDIIKFDSTEYITVPNNWATTSDSQITAIRENANSSVNENQIKKVYIADAGSNYANGLGQEVNILGDGTGAKVRVDVIGGEITDTVVTSGGKGYSYGIVDLGSLNSNAAGTYAKLVPIIPPSLGHGYDIYTELGTDKVLTYARFDDSTKDFPIDTKFAQVGIVKNPTSIGSTQIYTQNTFSSVYALKFSSISGTPTVGEKITQSVTGGVAKGYVSSYDSETKVLKYFVDRSLFLNETTDDQTDRIGVSTDAKLYNFASSSSNLVLGASSGFSGTIDINFTGINTNPTGTKIVNLGVNFTNGLASPEINKGSGEIIYLDNRPIINRNSRQKEDIKIILEF
jgi:Bacteriophage T4, Gp8